MNSKNRDWGNADDNTKGNILKNWMADNDINYKCNLYASDYPSFPRGNSFIDVCLFDTRLHIERQNNLIPSLLRKLKSCSTYQIIEI